MEQLFGPTGGYLVGFLATAWLVGTLADRGRSRTVPAALAATIAGGALVYLCGGTWLAVLIGAGSGSGSGHAAVPSWRSSEGDRSGARGFGALADTRRQTLRSGSCGSLPDRVRWQVTQLN
ncbi:biotin transporter BioY [Paracoccus sp. Z118]|uniref:biotin transporter BioY n=1 Tax=Paracoccus sp. Z118 TaxID=2851017 RepID=UPI0035300EA6